jgi:hypothetical protein
MELKIRMSVKIILPASTKVYCVSDGIVRLEDVNKVKLYSPYGGFRNVNVKRVGEKDTVKCVETGIVFGADTLPSIMFQPARKWFIKNCRYGLTEEQRRNLFNEHFALEPQPHFLVEQDDTEGYDHYHPDLNEPNVRAAYLAETIKFYGVSAHDFVSENGIAIMLDYQKPVCFVTKLMPYRTNELREHISYWRAGGWFRTVKPINNKMLTGIKANGIFFEGFKGAVAAIQTNPDTSKKRKEACVEITIPEGYGIDFGNWFIYIEEGVT